MSWASQWSLGRDFQKKKIFFSRRLQKNFFFSSSKTRNIALTSHSFFYIKAFGYQP